MNKKTQKLEDMRSLMSQHDIDAVIVPTADRHQSEYVPTLWTDRAWLSGFTGSAGTVVVTKHSAIVWTDARYYLICEEDLQGSEFSLGKHENRFEPTPYQHLLDGLATGSTIAVNGWNFTHNQYQSLLKLANDKGVKVIDFDIVEHIWLDRPAPSSSPIFDLPVVYSGEGRVEKLDRIRRGMTAKGVDGYLVTGMDEVAWLTNLRGSDVDYNPVFIAYAYVGTTSATLYVDRQKLDAELLVMVEENWKIKPYNTIIDDLASISPELNILVDPDYVNVKLHNAIGGKILHDASLIHDAKGIKNKTELNNLSQAMIADGVALTKAFYWLEKEVKLRGITETEFASKIAEERAKSIEYKGESFEAIIGYESNGAIMHYHPHPDTNKTIAPEGILLCDSGAQYMTGTTDITRTLALSPPSKERKTDYTNVLKGLISLSRAQFPIGTTGGHLDTLSRQFLWEQGQDFKHGTGHGVGYFLNVHEGPHGFAVPTSARGRTPLKVGMIITNEPGYYKDGHYGIRLENIMVVVPSHFDGFYAFDTVTLCYIDQTLIDEAILSPSEKAWVNQYHQEVLSKLTPHLEDVEVKDWLIRKCKPLN